MLLGTAVAVPEDGTNAFPGGQWSVTSTVDLNNPALFPHDGVRHILVTAEDLAGNVSSPDALTIFIDTQGPQITNVQVNSTTSTYNLFGQKPTNAAQGPTPLVNSLIISVVDNPARDTVDFPNYLALLIPTPVVTITAGGSGYTSPPTVTFSGGGATAQATGIALLTGGVVTGVEITSSGNGYTSAPTVTFSGGGFTVPATATAILQSPGDFVLQGDASGIIAIKSVVITDNPTVNGQPATATIQLVFYAPLPDDRYTLTIDDSSVTDPAGNKLDGESNADEPNGAPSFPSGNGIPGGNFVARFTVDSRPELGTWSGGSVYVDTNGNFVFDPTNLDAVNRDLTYTLGFTSDNLFAGNFGTAYTHIPGAPNGFSKLAAYGRVGTQYRWLFTDDTGTVVNSPIETSTFGPPGSLNALPVAGNFSDVKALGDQVGLFDGSNWYLDVNNDGVLDTVVPSKITGYPIVGDFDGDGRVDLGTYRDGTFYFQLGTGPGTFSSTVQTIVLVNNGIQLGALSRPVAADMDQDGITDIGLYVPDGSGATGTAASEWYWFVSGGQTPVFGSVSTLNHTFSQTPLGHDLFAKFGNNYAMPIVGNFDPPSSTASQLNTPPSASVTTPASPQGGSVTISYSLTDAESNACSILAQYSTDGGATWKTAKAGSGGDGTTGLASSPTGVSHTFVWAYSSDIGGGNASVKVRITPTDTVAGTAGTSNAFTVQVSADMTAAVMGDFNGDGTSDVLWFNQSTGLVGFWTIKNGAYAGWASLGTADPTTWKLAGVGDFNADGTSDVLWFNQSTGLVGAWIIKKGAYAGWATLGTVDPAVWKVAGVGDFNGDKTSDVLWQNQSTGVVGAWIVKKSANAGWAGLGTADPTTWKLAGVGDFNGDKTSDVLWQNQSTGTVVDWLVKNGATTGYGTLGSADPVAWKVAGVGDFNGDGTSDVLWQNQSTGLTGDWLIKKNAYSSWATVGTYDPTVWKVAGVGDFNGDKTSDVLWQNQSTGSVTTSLVKNGATTRYASLGTADPVAWHVGGATYTVETVAYLQAASVVAAPDSSVASLTQSELQPIVAEAIARWASAGLDAATLNKLSHVQFVIGDLAGAELGEAVVSADRVYIDTNAAGNGWFVDPTPATDEEFVAAGNSQQLQAVDPRAVDRIDLLTVVEHELGHIAGLDDLNALADNLMSGVLANGIRRDPYQDSVDLILASR